MGLQRLRQRWQVHSVAHLLGGFEAGALVHAGADTAVVCIRAAALPGHGLLLRRDKVVAAQQLDSKARGVDGRLAFR